MIKKLRHILYIDAFLKWRHKRHLQSLIHNDNTDIFTKVLSEYELWRMDFNEYTVKERVDTKIQMRSTGFVDIYNALNKVRVALLSKAKDRYIVNLPQWYDASPTEVRVDEFFVDEHDHYEGIIVLMDKLVDVVKEIQFLYKINTNGLSEAYYNTRASKPIKEMHSLMKQL